MQAQLKRLLAGRFMTKLLATLALAVGFTTAATAATPVAVWDGDFTTTIEGYTLTLNGNTAANGFITIANDATKGVQVDFSSAMTSGMTVMFRYSDLSLGSQQSLAASCVAQNGTADRTGVYLGANNQSHGIWGTGTYDTSVTTQETMTDGQLSGTFALTYKGGSGTYLYRIADSVCTRIYGNPKLMAGSDGSIWGCTVGGTRSATFGPAKGLKIAGIAIFNGVLSTAEMADYKWPSWLVTTPTNSLGFDNGKEVASTILGGTALTGTSEWDSGVTYTKVRGSDSNYAMTISSSSPKGIPYKGSALGGMTDSTSWSVHASMKLAEVEDGVLFSLSPAVWSTCKYIGVEYVGNDQVRVVYGSGKGVANKNQLIAPVTVAGSKTKFHSYLLTFNASASGTAGSPYYTLYVDGVKAGDSGDIPKHTGYASGWCIGNYYGGADQVPSAKFDGAQIDDFAAWGTTCLNAEQAADLASKFETWPNSFNYTATFSTDTKWSELSWTPAKPGTGFSPADTFTINNTAGAKLTFDENVTAASIAIENESGKALSLACDADKTVTAEWDFTDAAGGISFAYLDGTELAKNAVAGAPYSYWTGLKGSVTGTPTVICPSVPDGYTITSETLADYGVRLVVTAPAFAKLGATSVNLYRNTALGTGVSGLYSVDRSHWNSLTIANGASGTYDGITFTLSSNASSWAQGNVGDPIYQDYIDDANNTTKSVTITDITYPKYRIIVYFNCDSGDNLAFYPMVANGVSYAGAYKDGTASTTVKGATTTWGKSGTRGTPAEGNNALVTDVMTDATVTLNFANTAGRGSARATPAAIQVVQVGEVVYEPKNYTAEISSAVNLSEIVWTPAKTRPFGLSDTLTVTVSANATLTFDADAPVEKLTVVSAAGADLTLAKGDVTLTLPAYDFSGAAGKTKVSYDPGAASVKAGADTVLGAVSAATLTIAADKKATVKSGSLTASKVSNSGTLYFEGGTAENPISITGDANLGAVTLAANTYVKCDDKGGNRKHQVTGSGASSFYELTRNNGGSAGMAAYTTFNNVILVSGAEGNNAMWLERATMTDAGLDAKGTIKISDLSPTIRSLTGSGIVGKSGTAALTIACSENANYSGASDLAFTIAAGTAVQTLSGAYTGALTVNAGGEVRLTGNAAPGSVINNGTVDIDFASAYRLTWDNDGTINLGNGDLLIQEGVTPGTINETGTGKYYYAYTVNINHMGRFALPEGKTVDRIKLYDAAGNLVDAQFNESTQMFEFDWKIDGGACWWDYEFNGTLANSGTDTVPLAKELTDPYYNSESNALRVGYATPWRDVSGYPEEFTAVIHGRIVNTQNQFELGFGSSSTAGTGANGAYSVAIACGDPTKEEVVLIVSKGTTVQKTVTMSVPNAYSADHLYAFACKTVTDNATQKTKVVVYLDGTEWDSYLFDSVVTLGKGFQIGSVHGNAPSGYSKATTANKNAYLDFLRVYNVVMGADAMTRYANTYPYNSVNGNAARTFAGGTTTWTENGAWNVTPNAGEQYVSNMPPSKAIVSIKADAAATVAFDLDEAATYEQLKIQSGAAITLNKGGTVKPTVSGLTSVDANLTVAYDAIGFGNVMVADGKTLTFDFTTLDLSKEYVSRTIDLTGKPSGVGTITYANLTQAAGRTATFRQNPDSDHWELVITVKGELQTTVQGSVAFGNLVWTMGGETVTPDWTLIKAAKIIAGSDASVDFGAAALEGVVFTVTGDNAITFTGNTSATLDFGATRLANLNGSYAHATDGTVTASGSFKHAAGTLKLANSTITALAFAAGTAIELYGENGITNATVDGNVDWTVKTGTTTFGFDLEGNHRIITGANIVIDAGATLVAQTINANWGYRGLTINGTLRATKFTRPLPGAAVISSETGVLEVGTIGYGNGSQYTFALNEVRLGEGGIVNDNNNGTTFVGFRNTTVKATAGWSTACALEISGPVTFDTNGFDVNLNAGLRPSATNQLTKAGVGTLTIGNDAVVSGLVVNGGTVSLAAGKTLTAASLTVAGGALANAGTITGVARLEGVDFTAAGVGVVAFGDTVDVYGNVKLSKDAAIALNGKTINVKAGARLDVNGKIGRMPDATINVEEGGTLINYKLPPTLLIIR